MGLLSLGGMRHLIVIILALVVVDWDRVGRAVKKGRGEEIFFLAVIVNGASRDSAPDGRACTRCMCHMFVETEIVIGMISNVPYPRTYIMHV